MIFNPLQGKSTKTLTSSRKWIFFKELKVQIWTYELHGLEVGGGGEEYHGKPHRTLKKTISKTGVALKRVNP